jgi:N-acetylglucosamine-6-phosphate deacetylase
VLRVGREERDLPVLVEGGRISALGPRARRAARRALRRVDLEGAYLAPGLVDIHTHGAAGVDFFSASRTELEEAILGHYLPHGVTSLLLSLYPAPPRELCATVRTLAGEIRGGLGRGAALGIHLEGPFLNPRKPGALPGGAFRPVERKLALELIEAGGGTVRTQTVAAELRGGLELIRLLRRRRVAPFLGHTAAGLEEARAAFGAGARAVTHLFNAMEPMHHRAPGPIAASLLDDRVAVELIADGFHVAPEALALVVRSKPISRICLISDSVAPCGLADGRYEFAGAPVRLKGGRVTLLDGTLAGSALTLERALQVMAREVGVSAAEAVEMATASPARAAGLRGRGEIKPGRRADLVVLDDRLRVRATYLAGERVHLGR